MHVVPADPRPFSSRRKTVDVQASLRNGMFTETRLHVEARFDQLVAEMPPETSETLEHVLFGATRHVLARDDGRTPTPEDICQVIRQVLDGADVRYNVSLTGARVIYYGTVLNDGVRMLITYISIMGGGVAMSIVVGNTVPIAVASAGALLMFAT